MCHTSLSLCKTRSPPPLPIWYVSHLDLDHPYHLPASAARLCSPRCMPNSTAVYRALPTPLFWPTPAPRSLLALGGGGGGGCAGTSVFLLFLNLPPCVILCLLSSSGVWYMIGWTLRARRWGARAPPLTVSRPTYQPPPLPVVLILYPRLKFVVCISRRSWYMRI